MHSSEAELWSTAVFVDIARAQNELEDALAKRALQPSGDLRHRRVRHIRDWHRRYVGDCITRSGVDCARAEHRSVYPDRHGHPLRAGLHARRRASPLLDARHVFIDELERWQKAIPWRFSGGRARRLRAAVAAIDAMLPGLTTPVPGNNAAAPLSSRREAGSTPRSIRSAAPTFRPMHAAPRVEDTGPAPGRDLDVRPRRRDGSSPVAPARGHARNGPSWRTPQACASETA